jgi:hypothetical protein
MSTSASPPELPPELRQLVDQGGALRPVTSGRQDELWWSLLDRAQPRRRGPRIIASVALTGAVALVALLLWGSRPTSRPTSTAAATRSTTAAEPMPAPLQLPPLARTVHLGKRVDLGLWPDAQVTLPPTTDPNQRGPYRVRLDRGRMAASVAPRLPEEPLAVLTPQLSVFVVGTRFSVDVDHDVTTVAVEEGRVRVERAQRILYLSAGDSVRSDDPRLRGEAHAVPCADERELDGRRACLTREAAGQGLAAENALFALGMLARGERDGRARAIAHFRDHQRRFPAGVLAPEVALALADLLLADGHREQACAELNAFVRLFPRDHTTRDRLRSLCDQ